MIIKNLPIALIRLFNIMDHHCHDHQEPSRNDNVHIVEAKLGFGRILRLSVSNNLSKINIANCLSY